MSSKIQVQNWASVDVFFLTLTIINKFQITIKLIAIAVNWCKIIHNNMSNNNIHHSFCDAWFENRVKLRVVHSLLLLITWPFREFESSCAVDLLNFHMEESQHRLYIHLWFCLIIPSCKNSWDSNALSRMNCYILIIARVCHTDRPAVGQKRLMNCQTEILPLHWQLVDIFHR